MAVRQPLSDFFGGVLTSLHLPNTPQNRAFLLGWSQKENTQAANNPLATTLHLSGSYALPNNSAGVQQYPTAQQGIVATASTLTGYPSVLAALRSGNPQGQGLSSGLVSDFNRWSGGGGVSYAQSVLSMASQNPSGAPATPIGAIAPGSIIDSRTGKTIGTLAPTKLTSPLQQAADLTGITSLTDFVSKIASTSFILRALEVVGGAILAMAGLYLLAKQIGLAPSTPSGPVGEAAAVAA